MIQGKIFLDNREDFSLSCFLEERITNFLKIFFLLYYKIPLVRAIKKNNFEEKSFYSIFLSNPRPTEY